MECVGMLGVAEHGTSDQDRKDNALLLRFLTSFCKLYTAKCAVFCASEGIECLGGIGYLETCDMSRIFRDSQVLPIWEGTTNLLSLDILRVLNHKKYGRKTLDLYYKRIEDIIALNRNDTKTLDEQLSVLKRFWSSFGTHSKLSQLYGRDIAFSLCRIYCAALLYEHSYHTKNAIDINVYKTFISGDMQSSFLCECGKSLIAQSLINLLENKVAQNQYGDRIKYLHELGMGKYSKL